MQRLGIKRMDATGLAPGLYLVATPIGTARDITLRALDILSSADLLAAEDTRNTRRLLDIHGIALNGRRLISYHDHNGDRQRPVILKALQEGRSVAYVSDAGTPMLADPGFDLSRAVIAEGLPVLAAPGASALLAALCVAGQPTDRFLFAGFPPNKKNARLKFFADLSDIEATLVFYESPKRIHRSLTDMVQAYGAGRNASVCRELTKKFETVHRGSLAELVDIYGAIERPKGEIVVVLGPPVARVADTDEIDAALRDALASMRVKEAANAVSARLGVSRKTTYQRALEVKKVL
ncbi:MAG: 16S rRNA (cytidine(1402)-2'-O)-methyltransferase [Rhodobacteraceae bacterium]|nr:16S rRNA (cytidine(1402)-2'-O)-methyltransferase [Paracoccaceae bacterium]